VTAGTNTTGTGDVTSSTPLTITLNGATGDFALRLRGGGVGTYTATFASGGSTLTTYVVTVVPAYTISNAVPSPTSSSVATGYGAPDTQATVALTRAGGAGSNPTGIVSVDSGTWTVTAGTSTTGGGTVTSASSQTVTLTGATGDFTMSLNVGSPSGAYTATFTSGTTTVSYIVTVGVYTIVSAVPSPSNASVPTDYMDAATQTTVTLTRAGGTGSNPTATVLVGSGTWMVMAGTSTTGGGTFTSSAPVTVTLEGATGNFELHLITGMPVGAYTATVVSGGSTLATYVVTVSTAYTVSNAVPDPLSAAVATGYSASATQTTVTLTRAGASGSAPTGTVSVNAGTWTLTAGTNTSGGGTVVNGAPQTVTLNAASGNFMLSLNAGSPAGTYTATFTSGSTTATYTVTVSGYTIASAVPDPSSMTVATGFVGVTTTTTVALTRAGGSGLNPTGTLSVDSGSWALTAGTSTTGTATVTSGASATVTLNGATGNFTLHLIAGMPAGTYTATFTSGGVTLATYVVIVAPAYAIATAMPSPTGAGVPTGYLSSSTQTTVALTRTGGAGSAPTGTVSVDAGTWTVTAGTNTTGGGAVANGAPQTLTLNSATGDFTLSLDAGASEGTYNATFTSGSTTVTYVVTVGVYRIASAVPTPANAAVATGYSASATNTTVALTRAGGSGSAPTGTVSVNAGTWTLTAGTNTTGSGAITNGASQTVTLNAASGNFTLSLNAGSPTGTYTATFTSGSTSESYTVTVDVYTIASAVPSPSSAGVPSDYSASATQTTVTLTREGATGSAPTGLVSVDAGAWTLTAGTNTTGGGIVTSGASQGLTLNGSSGNFTLRLNAGSAVGTYTATFTSGSTTVSYTVTVGVYTIASAVPSPLSASVATDFIGLATSTTVTLTRAGSVGSNPIGTVSVDAGTWMVTAGTGTTGGGSVTNGAPVTVTLNGATGDFALRLLAGVPNGTYTATFTSGGSTLATYVVTVSAAYTISNAVRSPVSASVAIGYTAVQTETTVTLTRAGGAGSAPTGTVSVNAGTWTVTAGTHTTGGGAVVNGAPQTVTLNSSSGDFALSLNAGSAAGTYTATFTSGSTTVSYVVTVGAYTIASAVPSPASVSVGTDYMNGDSQTTVALTRAGGTGSAPTGTVSVNAGTWMVMEGTNTTGGGTFTNSAPVTVTLDGATGDFELHLIAGSPVGTYTATFTSGSTTTSYVVTVSTAYTISSAVPSPLSASVATGYGAPATQTTVTLARAGAAGSAPTGRVSVNAGTWTLTAGAHTSGGGAINSSVSQTVTLNDTSGNFTLSLNAGSAAGAYIATFTSGSTTFTYTVTVDLYTITSASPGSMNMTVATNFIGLTTMKTVTLTRAGGTGPAPTGIVSVDRGTWAISDGVDITGLGDATSSTPLTVTLLSGTGSFVWRLRTATGAGTYTARFTSGGVVLATYVVTVAPAYAISNAVPSPGSASVATGYSASATQTTVTLTRSGEAGTAPMGTVSVDAGTWTVTAGTNTTGGGTVTNSSPQAVTLNGSSGDFTLRLNTGSPLGTYTATLTSGSTTVSYVVAVDVYVISNAVADPSGITVSTSYAAFSTATTVVLTRVGTTGSSPTGTLSVDAGTWTLTAGTSTGVSGVSVTSGTPQTVTLNGPSGDFTLRLNTGSPLGTYTATLTSGSTTVSYTVTVGATAPGVPTMGSATAGNASALVSWTAPSSDGGSAITGYTVTASAVSGHTCTAGASTTSCTVTRLTNGTSYTFTVTATNAVGTSAPSAESDEVTPLLPALPLSPEPPGVVIAPPIATSDAPVIEMVTAGAGGMVDATVQGTGGSSVVVSVTVPNGATPNDISVTIAPAVTPAEIASGLMTVKVTVTDLAGTPITHFDLPLSINLGHFSYGTPAYSQDGLVWIVIQKLEGTTLPVGVHEGYYVDAVGSIIILTDHLTYFGMKRVQPLLALGASALSVRVGGYVMLTPFGGKATGTISFTSNTPTTCSVTSFGIVTALSPGTCTVVATKTGDGTYLNSTSLPVTLIIQAKPVIVIVQPTRLPPGLPQTGLW
jgi:hypothetical protein